MARNHLHASLAIDVIGKLSRPFENPDEVIEGNDVLESSFARRDGVTVPGQLGEYLVDSMYTDQPVNPAANHQQRENAVYRALFEFQDHEENLDHEKGAGKEKTDPNPWGRAFSWRLSRISVSYGGKHRETSFRS